MLNLPVTTCVVQEHLDPAVVAGKIVLCRRGTYSARGQEPGCVPGWWCRDDHVRKYRR